MMTRRVQTVQYWGGWRAWLTIAILMALAWLPFVAGQVHRAAEGARAEAAARNAEGAVDVGLYREQRALTAREVRAFGDDPDGSIAYGKALASEPVTVFNPHSSMPK